jgi:hypothetical protein
MNHSPLRYTPMSLMPSPSKSTDLGRCGSYSSALLRLLKVLLVAFRAPATSTFPLGNSVAVWPERGVLRLAVTLQVTVAGSYGSVFLVLGSAVQIRSGVFTFQPLRHGKTFSSLKSHQKPIIDEHPHRASRSNEFSTILKNVFQNVCMAGISDCVNRPLLAASLAILGVRYLNCDGHWR